MAALLHVLEEHTWQASVPSASSPPSPLPLAAALLTGVASIVGGGVGHDNNGNSATTQQNQGDDDTSVTFTPLWW